jgi:uncharacterized protein YegL
MKKDYTHIAVLLDRSGSMSTIAKDIIGGFNTFVKDQKKLKSEATLTLCQFDTEYETIYHTVPVKEVKNLTDKTFIPRGGTALNDSLVVLINETGKELAALSEDQRPDKVIVLVISDGEENSSKEYSRWSGGDEKLSKLVTEQETKWNWQFIYIGANQDSYKESASKGMSNAFNFEANSRGVDVMYSSLSATVSNFRNTGIVETDIDKIDLSLTETK